jgi:hypothetical protein
MTESTTTMSTPEQQVTQPQLTINDLVAARDTIKTTLERGGLFKVDEMQVVMTVYKRFNEFIEYAEAVTKANEAKAASEKEAAEQQTTNTTSMTSDVNSPKGV